MASFFQAVPYLSVGRSARECACDERMRVVRLSRMGRAAIVDDIVVKLGMCIFFDSIANCGRFADPASVSQQREPRTREDFFQRILMTLYIVFGSFHNFISGSNK